MVVLVTTGAVQCFVLLLLMMMKLLVMKRSGRRPGWFVHVGSLCMCVCVSRSLVRVCVVCLLYWLCTMYASSISLSLSLPLYRFASALRKVFIGH